MILGQCSSVVRGTLVIYRAAPSRIISFYPGGNAFIRGELEALVERVRSVSSIHTAISFISPPREEDVPLKYRRGSLSLVTLSFPGFAARRNRSSSSSSFSSSSPDCRQSHTINHNERRRAGFRTFSRPLL